MSHAQVKYLRQTLRDLQNQTTALATVVNEMSQVVDAVLRQPRIDPGEAAAGPEEAAADPAELAIAEVESGQLLMPLCTPTNKWIITFMAKLVARSAYSVDAVGPPKWDPTPVILDDAQHYGIVFLNVKLPQDDVRTNLSKVARELLVHTRGRLWDEVNHYVRRIYTPVMVEKQGAFDFVHGAKGTSVVHTKDITLQIALPLSVKPETVEVAAMPARLCSTDADDIIYHWTSLGAEDDTSVFSKYVVAVTHDDLLSYTD